LFIFLIGINVIVENSIPLPTKMEDGKVDDDVEYEEELVENVE
jgi:hypothetical protein